MSRTRLLVLSVLSISAFVTLIAKGVLAHGAYDLLGVPGSAEILALALLSLLACHFLSRPADSLVFLSCAAVFIAAKWLFAPLGGAFGILVLLPYYATMIAGIDLSLTASLGITDPRIDKDLRL